MNDMEFEGVTSIPEIAEVEKLRRQIEPAWKGRKVLKFTAPIKSPKPKKYLQGD